MKSKNNIITVLDIGTTKIVCLVALISSNKNISVIAATNQLANGFKNGVIIDLKKAEHSIISAIERVEKHTSNSISKVFVSLSNANISSNTINSSINLTNHPITDRDVNKVIGQCLEQFNLPGNDVVHYFPLDYHIDQQGGIKDPTLMFGSHLSSDVHIVSSSSNSILNLANCLARCHLNIEDFIVSSYASSIACLTKDEMELGVLLIDIGGYNTSFSIFNKDNFIFSDVVALGGQHITADIAMCFGLNLIEAERIKIIHGNAVSTSFDENKIIEIIADLDNPDSDISNIKMCDLSQVIRSRIEEIFDMIKTKLEKSAFNKNLPKRVVLTGGGSQMLGLKELAQHILNGQIRIAQPRYFEGVTEEFKGPSFATALGMLKIISDNLANLEFTAKNNKKNMFKSLFNKIFG